MADNAPITEGCLNPDGTYDGVRLMQNLYRATCGKELTREEVLAEFEKAKARRGG